jgi:hypothetical protein
VLTRNSGPIPRWVGYFSIWFAVSMFPASLVVFFYHGPFAWNGVFGIYLPLCMFAIWYQVTTWYLHRSITLRAAEPDPDPASGPDRDVPAAAGSNTG